METGNKSQHECARSGVQYRYVNSKERFFILSCEKNINNIHMQYYGGKPVTLK